MFQKSNWTLQQVGIFPIPQRRCKISYFKSLDYQNYCRDKGTMKFSLKCFMNHPMKRSQMFQQVHSHILLPFGKVHFPI